MGVRGANRGKEKSEQEKPNKRRERKEKLFRHNKNIFKAAQKKTETLDDEEHEVNRHQKKKSEGKLLIAVSPTLFHLALDMLAFVVSLPQCLLNESINQTRS